MILDSEQAEQIYKQAITGDPHSIEEFHSICRPLIEVVATSLDPTKFSDLVQEGHLKIQLIITKQSYCKQRGKMYSFLSTALRNHMLDSMRTPSITITVPCEEIELNVPLSTYIDKGSSSCWEDVAKYVARRFPSLGSSIMGDVATYVVEAMIEGCNGLCKGAARTVSTMYPISKHSSLIVCRACLSVCRMEAIGHPWRANIDAAIELANVKHMEMTLVPEVVLLLGSESADKIKKIFDGSFVKF